MVISSSSPFTVFIFTLFLLTVSFHFTSGDPSAGDAAITTTCSDIHRHNTTTSKCHYVKSQAGCQPKGYINYLQFFYCNSTQFPQLGFLLLLIWLVVLFYLLSNTASEYFCPAVEDLSRTLNLSPAIAGTTLLPLGNGAPDVFSSVIAFTASGDGGDIGVNSILGGSIFISTVVVGVLSLLITFRRKIVVVDKPNFIRDVVFLLFTLSNLLIIIIIGRINFWVSVLFVSSYIIYIVLASYMHFKNMKKQRIILYHASASVNHENGEDDEQGATVPLLGPIDEENVVHPAEKSVHCAEQAVPHKQNRFIRLSLYIISLPFYLPRRATIPVITMEKWSKPLLVISLVLSPIMVALVWDTQGGKMGLKASLVTYFVAGAIGVALGACTFVLTSSTMPPQTGLFLWYASGFLMSVIWTYVTCNELVSLLESLGNVIGISPSIIGLTILAWGNSIGDLTANVAMAMYGGPDGAQIAMSGCYAGPLFNILIGLGFSFIFVSWSSYPASYVITEDPNLCESVGFLIASLLWALVVLPKRGMRLDQTLGVGLLAIYVCFLFIKLARVLGLLSVTASNL